MMSYVLSCFVFSCSVYTDINAETGKKKETHLFQDVRCVLFVVHLHQSHHHNKRLPLGYYCFVQSCHISSWVWAFRGHSPQERAASSMTPLRSVQKAAPGKENRCCKKWIILTSMWKQRWKFIHKMEIQVSYNLGFICFSLSVFLW